MDKLISPLEIVRLPLETRVVRAAQGDVAAIESLAFVYGRKGTNYENAAQCEYWVRVGIRHGSDLCMKELFKRGWVP